MKAIKQLGFLSAIAVACCLACPVVQAEDTSPVRVGRVRTSDFGRSGYVGTTMTWNPDLQVHTNTLAYFDIKAGSVPVGRMTVELFNDARPETVRNFLSYVQSSAYTNGFLHRCLSNFIVQGGGYYVDDPTSTSPLLAYAAAPTFTAITNEYNLVPTLPNAYGTIAMAKGSGNPNSATSQWFFNLADNSAMLGTNNLGGYTVFGRVIEQTNYLAGDTNLLEFFADRSKDPAQGIIDLTSYYGSGASLFSDLPVNFTGAALPRYADLYSVVVTAPGAPDGILPSLTVVVPAESATTILSNFTARGTASDNLGVTSVQTRINGGAWMDVSGTTNWSFDYYLPQGTNTLDFRSLDLEGNSSALATRSVIVDPSRAIGTYEGLFMDTNNVTYETAGAMELTLNTKLTFTATLWLAGDSHKFKGQFDDKYRATNSAALQSGGNLVVEWLVNPTNGNGQVLGRVINTNAAWVSPLLANRALKNVKAVKDALTPLNEDYTMNLINLSDGLGTPGGWGLAFGKVDKSGSMTMRGSLPDGTSFSRKAYLSAGKASWPLYVDLYNKRGMVIGWFTYADLASSDFNGQVTWIKQPKGNGNKYYEDGFTNSLGGLITLYAPPGVGKPVNFTNAIVALSGGGLTQSWTNSVTVKIYGGVENNSTNSLSVGISGSVGQFSGSFTEPNTRTQVSFRGVMNQEKLNAGYGYFLNDDDKLSGYVYFGP